MYSLFIRVFVSDLNRMGVCRVRCFELFILKDIQDGKIVFANRINFQGASFKAEVSQQCAINMDFVIYWIASK